MRWLGWISCSLLRGGLHRPGAWEAMGGIVGRVLLKRVARAGRLLINPTP
jgi:hypothetical protein